MRNEELISSGMLELYAVGGLTPSEREEVERQASASAEVRAALDEACAAMEGYASQYATPPPASLKARVMEKIQAAEGAAATYKDNVRPLEPAKAPENPANTWLVAASVIVALLSGVLSFFFYQKWQTAEEKLALAVAAEQRYAQNFNYTSQQLKQQEQTIAILRDEEYRPVQLKGVEAHPDARITVYWNPRSARVYVDEVQLPKPPTGKQYQLWALADGKPIDAGLIDAAPEQQGLQQMKEIKAAQAFAVTLEPAGGSVSPTLDNLTVIGEIGT